MQRFGFYLILESQAHNFSFLQELRGSESTWTVSAYPWYFQVLFPVPDTQQTNLNKLKKLISSQQVA